VTNRRKKGTGTYHIDNRITPFGMRRKENIMSTHPKHTATHNLIDPMLETLIKEMIETESHPKGASKADEIFTTTQAEALKEAISNAISQASEYERALWIATLAPALAESLAPILAEALTPALITALSNMPATRKTGNESSSSKGERN
jgi:hypothetical protein